MYEYSTTHIKKNIFFYSTRLVRLCVGRYVKDPDVDGSAMHVVSGGSRTGSAAELVFFSSLYLIRVVGRKYQNSGMYKGSFVFQFYNCACVFLPAQTCSCFVPHVSWPQFGWQINYTWSAGNVFSLFQRIDGKLTFVKLSLLA